MHERENSYKCDPPGTFREIVPHPGKHDRAIEKAVVMEHRFAFFFWMKWHNTLRQRGWLRQHAPTLVTMDWHRDLAAPTEEQKAALEKLNPVRLDEVAKYVWAHFDQTNDGHILCAAWLDLIGDVILLQNTGSKRQDTFQDMNGNKHIIYEFREYKQLTEFLSQREDQNIFLDIDLDYFIHGKGTREGYYSDNFHRYADEEIRQIIDYQKPVFQHILPHIDGITIAQEPSYCGGITNSCHIMEIIHSQLFDGEHNWRHLKKEST
ncbi:MAG: hypothetical protein PVH63_09055 [Balneolaceae bacterium]|jgi:hypothetical protein